MLGVIAREMLGLEDEEVEVQEITELLPLDALAFMFDSDVDLAYDAIASANAEESMTDTIWI
ncbi:hypothetical protein SLS61_010219 [Didymella pomorum]